MPNIIGISVSLSIHIVVIGSLYLYGSLSDYSLDIDSVTKIEIVIEEDKEIETHKQTISPKPQFNETAIQNTYLKSKTVEKKTYKTSQPKNDISLSQKKLFSPAQYTLGSKLNPLPPYPKKAIRKGWEGTVLLNALVDRYGKVKTLSIKKSSQYNILDRSAIKTIQTWVFTPGKLNNQSIETSIDIPIRFSLIHSS